MPSGARACRLNKRIALPRWDVRLPSSPLSAAAIASAREAGHCKTILRRDVEEAGRVIGDAAVQARPRRRERRQARVARKERAIYAQATMQVLQETLRRPTKFVPYILLTSLTIWLNICRPWQNKDRLQKSLRN